MPLFRIDRITPRFDSPTNPDHSLRLQKEQARSLAQQKTDLNDQNSHKSPSQPDTSQIQSSQKGQLLNFRKARDHLGRLHLLTQEHLIINYDQDAGNTLLPKNPETLEYSKRELKYLKNKVLDNAQTTVPSRVSEQKENQLTAFFLKESFIEDYKTYRHRIRKAGIEKVYDAIDVVSHCEDELQEMKAAKDQDYSSKREKVKSEVIQKLRINECPSQIQFYQRPYDFKDYKGSENDLVKLFDPLPAQPRTQIEKKMSELKNGRSIEQIQRKVDKGMKKSKSKTQPNYFLSKGCHTETNIFKVNFKELRQHMNCKFVSVVVNTPPDISFTQIEKLKINEIGDNGFIFFWTVAKDLDRAFSLIKRWGYNLIDELTWTKLDSQGKVQLQAKNIDQALLLNSHQICVAGYKSNSLSNPDYVSKIQSDFISTSGEVSNQKPIQFYLTLECMTPGTAKIEVFSEEPRQGWITIAHTPQPFPHFECSVCEQIFAYFDFQRYKCSDSRIELCQTCFKLHEQGLKQSTNLEDILSKQEVDEGLAIQPTTSQSPKFLSIPSLRELKRNWLECSNCKEKASFVFNSLALQDKLVCQKCFDQLSSQAKKGSTVVYQRKISMTKKGRADQEVDPSKRNSEQKREWLGRYNPHQIVVDEPRRVRYCSVCLNKIKERGFYSCKQCYELICCLNCYLVCYGMKMHFSDLTHNVSHEFMLVWERRASDEEEELSYKFN